MEPAAQLVTVYRSMDATAKEDCEQVVDILRAQAISAVMLDDDALGWWRELLRCACPPRMPEKAEKIIADYPLPDEVENVDDSSALD